MNIKSAFLILLVILPSIAAAHPIDDPCLPGKFTEDSCQPRHSFMGLDNDAFFAAHKGYWHCRRELNEDIRIYSECVGGVNDLQGLLGLAEFKPEPAILNYWNVLPAHPELDYPGQVWRPVTQMLACEATRAIASLFLNTCELKRAELAEKARQAIKPMVCPTKRPRR